MPTLQTLVVRYWNSPGATTAASVLARALGMVAPLVCLYYFKFPPQVIAYWLLVTTFQSVVGGINGSLPTLSMQMLSFAHAGSNKIFGTMDDHRNNRGGGPNRGLIAHINQALVRIYGWVQWLWLAIAAFAGTAIIWSSLAALPVRDEGALAWVAFVLLSAVRLRMQPYIAYLFAVGETAYARRIECFAWLIGAVVTGLSFLFWGNIALAMLCLYAPVFVQYLIVRRKAEAFGWEVDCPERAAYFGYAVIQDIWPRAWRGALGISAGMLTAYGGGFLYAQYGGARELAGYLLAVNVLGILQQIVISPLYGALPAMANRYVSGDREGLFSLADHVLRRSAWLFALTVCVVPVGLFFANDLLNLDVHFLTLTEWAALCFATFILRYGGGHLAFYTISNDIVLHRVNGLYLLLYLGPLALIGRVPLMTFFVTQAVASLLYAGIARHLTRKYMHYPLRRDSGFTLAAAAVMIGLLTLSCWALPYLRTMV